MRRSPSPWCAFGREHKCERHGDIPRLRQGGWDKMTLGDSSRGTSPLSAAHAYVEVLQRQLYHGGRLSQPRVSPESGEHYVSALSAELAVEEQARVPVWTR